MTTSKMYMVKVIPGGRSLSYRETGGKKYTQRPAAVAQLNSLRKKGVLCELYEAEINWVLVDAQVPDNMEPLF